MIEKDFLNSGRKCRSSVAKETFYKVNQAFALPKGSSLGPLFNKKYKFHFSFSLCNLTYGYAFQGCLR